MCMKAVEVIAPSKEAMSESATEIDDRGAHHEAGVVQGQPGLGQGQKSAAKIRQRRGSIHGEGLIRRVGPEKITRLLPFFCLRGRFADGSILLLLSVSVRLALSQLWEAVIHVDGLHGDLSTLPLGGKSSSAGES